MKRYLILILVCLTSISCAQKVNNHLTATIIGSGSPKFNVNRSGPSVLISYKSTQILVDMGNGTQANLHKNNTKIKDIDGLLFTHHHLDHNEEFAPIFIQSLLGGNQTLIAGPKQTTLLANYTLEIYNEDIEYRLSKSGRSLSDVTSNFTCKDLKGNAPFYIGDIKITYVPVNHTIATLAYRFEVGNESIVISGDLTYTEALPVLAKNADYLIMDSGGAIELGSKRNNKRKSGGKGKGGTKHKAHLDLTESSQMANEANVTNLVLTHFNFTNVDEAATTSELRKIYKGVILYGEDLMTLPIDQEAHSHGGTAHTHSHEDLSEIQNPCVVNLSFPNIVSITEDKQNDVRTITSNAIPNHSVGQFPTKGNPNKITEQEKIYNIDLSPKLAKNKTFVYSLGIDSGRPNYVFGVAINGVKFEPSANEYFINTTTNQPNSEWPVEALNVEVNLGEDCNNAHVQPNGEYHYHGIPTELVANFDESKMNLVGWAADGFPMYYKMGYKESMNSNSRTIELKSSYALKKGERSGNGIEQPNGMHSGKYVRDYEFLNNSGDLDECNGRHGVTPEFPNGTYYYIVSDYFPSASRCFMGTPSSDFKIGGNKKQTQQKQREDKSSNAPPDFTSMLKKMDSNKDGKISTSEARGKLKENFEKRDKNKDGYITEDEISRIRK